MLEENDRERMKYSGETVLENAGGYTEQRYLKYLYVVPIGDEFSVPRR